MLNQNFCEFLEYRITTILNSLRDEHLKGFWCDGVLLPNNEKEYSKITINDRRFVIMKVFMGKTGQDKYELKLHFGDKALDRYSKNLSLEDCFPNEKYNEWFNIDPINKEIEIKLDQKQMLPILAISTSLWMRQKPSIGNSILFLCWQLFSAN